MGRASDIIKKLSEDDQVLVGGVGDKLKKEDVDQEEYAMGLKVEMEHTDDEKIASEIVLDHLAEDPQYYTKLNQANL
jgi:hypothetical protein